MSIVILSGCSQEKNSIERKNMSQMQEELQKEIEESTAPELTAEQRKIVEQLSEKEIKEIDAAILEESSFQQQKVAKIIGNLVYRRFKREPSEVFELFYLERLILLVEQKKLIGYGNLRRMRFSEVKLAPL
jgi:hypothetical protein